MTQVILLVIGLGAYALLYFLFGCPRQTRRQQRPRIRPDSSPYNPFTRRPSFLERYGRSQLG